MTLSPYNAVVFDLDGTLLDTLFELGDLCNQVLERNGFPTHPIDRYRHLVGDGAEMLIKRALGDAADPDTVSRYLQEYLTLYRDVCGENTKPYPGIADLLNALVRRGLPLAVLSNKPHDLTLKNIAMFFPDIPFHSIFGQRDSVPRKPDPRGALEIAESLGLDPGRILYLGDTAVDMRTALSAGMMPVGVLWGFRDETELRNAGAAFILSHPRELLSLIDNRLS
jgi:phosphoglycolate phosphatase